MKLVQALLLSFGFFSAAADAQENSPVDVISGQLGALETRDFETAFSFASPQIQEQMQTPKRFGSMVEAQFPMMIAVKDVRYLEQIRGTGIAVQRVRIVDSEGRYFWFAYEMKRVEDTWRINGVMRLASPDEIV